MALASACSVTLSKLLTSLSLSFLVYKLRITMLAQQEVAMR